MRLRSTGIRFGQPLLSISVGRYTAGMYQIRAATPADAAVITHHRRRMFVDAGRQDNRVLDVMAEHFKPWVETRLADGRYLGWLTSENGTVVAGAGLIVLDWPPHPLDPRQDKRGYLLNVYVEPEHRRKKLASQLIDQALAEARKQKFVWLLSIRPTKENRCTRATASAGPMKCSTWSRWRAEPPFLLYSDLYAGFRDSTGRRNGHTDGAGPCHPERSQAVSCFAGSADSGPQLASVRGCAACKLHLCRGA